MAATDKEIGMRVLDRRNALALNQAELSARLRAAGLNWSQGTISKVELGERPVRLSEAQALATVLEITVNELSGAVDHLGIVMTRCTQRWRDARGRLRQARTDLGVVESEYTGIRMLVDALDGRDVLTTLSPNAFSIATFSRLDPAVVEGILGQCGVETETVDRIARDLLSDPDDDAIGAALQLALPRLVFGSVDGGFPEKEVDEYQRELEQADYMATGFDA